MRWKGRRGSEHVEDRRRTGRGVVAGGAGVLVLAVVVALLGGDPFAFLSGVSGPGQAASYRPANPEEDQAAQFVSVVLRDTEEVWSQLLAKAGRTYRKPTLVLFSGRVQSACGLAGAAVGPFYCPADEKIYIDLGFFTTLERRLGAPGDFAQAYVIAHEVGHHVQKLLGIHDRAETLSRQARVRGGEAAANQVSVRVELQADFLAGVWAHHADERFRILEEGDVEEALNAASRIGDDALQRRSGGSVVPDSFTHGTSRQRVAWFRRGLEEGDVGAGDTFDDALFARVGTR